MKMNFTISMSLSQRSAPQPAWATLPAADRAAMIRALGLDGDVDAAQLDGLPGPMAAVLAVSASNSGELLTPMFLGLIGFSTLAGQLSAQIEQARYGARCIISM